MNTNKLPQAGTGETSVECQRGSGQLEQWVSPTIVELDVSETRGKETAPFETTSLGAS